MAAILTIFGGLLLVSLSVEYKKINTNALILLGAVAGAMATSGVFLWVGCH